MARPKRYWTPPEIGDDFQLYTSDGMMIPANDEEGRNERAQFRAPGQLIEWGSQIIASGKFPFMRLGDLWRWGGVLSCTQLSHMEKDVPSFERSLERAAALVRRRMRNANLDSHLSKIGEDLEILRRQGAWSEIARLLADERELAEKEIATDSYWGTRWRDELVERFWYLKVQADSKVEYIDIRPSRAYHEEQEAD